MRKNWKRIVSIICLVALTGCSGGVVCASNVPEKSIEEGYQEDYDPLENQDNIGDGSEVSDENVQEDQEEWVNQEEEQGQQDQGKQQSPEYEPEEAAESQVIQEQGEPEEYGTEALAQAPLSVGYAAYVRGTGWQNQVVDGAQAGTTGMSKQVESLKVILLNAQSGDGIEYRAHVQGIGWQSWMANGAEAGAPEKGKRIEALQIRLTGEAAKKYDVYYRVHSAHFGWLGWAKNEEIAGTTGWSYAVEALEIRLVETGGKAPGSTEGHYKPALWETALTQVDETTSVNVRLEALNQIKAEKAADSLSLTATMSYNGKATQKIEYGQSINSIGESGFAVDFGNYGKYSVEIQFKRGNQVVGTKVLDMNIRASEYNIAPISATFPVVLFSLSVWDIKKSAAGRTIPTIVMLGRPSAYDWDALPEGMYAMPYLSKGDIQKGADYTAFQQYVKDLYEISPGAKFNLYINDITCSYIHRVIYANKIPAGQYTITLMSDGSATYNIFNETYKGADARQKHAGLINEWNAAKNRAYSTGSVESSWGWHKHWDCMYAVLACEPGTQWWVARNNLFTSGDASFTEEVKNAVTVKSVNSMLNDLQSKGDGVVQEFKSLYNFNDGYFEEAASQGKKAMMILGTYVNNEKNFKDYANLTKLYYGDEYLYYYKGHPNTPTGMYPSKSEQLDELGITDVDSSIAAELILFFNPDIRLSGYSTSTFNSASDEMACGLYGMNKTEAFSGNSGVNYSGIDWFASPIDRNSAAADILALCPGNSVCYMVELSDAILSEGKYDFAIYDATKDILSFYKESGGKYETVDVLSNEKNLEYTTHVQTFGWQAPVNEGTISGTVGNAKRLEAITIKNISDRIQGDIEYRSHIQTYGWEEGWKSGGAVSGTQGEAKRLEAIQIRLTGELAGKYDVYYRVHVQTFGWLDWAKNGESAGSEGYSKRLEAIQIKLVKKNGSAPGRTEDAFRKKSVGYQTHVQSYGWQPYVYDGDLSGTEGASKRLEGIRIKNMDSQTSGSIRYRSHIQSIGWETGWKSDGKLSGTTGRAKRLEAIQIEFTGDLSQKYDVYYRVHVQSYGWLDWAKNGENAGTEGLAKRLEAIEIKYVKKGGKAPGKTDTAFIMNK